MPTDSTTGITIECLDQVARESKLLVPGVVAGACVDFQGSEMIRIEVEIDLQNPVEALAKNAGGDKQHNGESHLDHNQV